MSKKQDSFRVVPSPWVAKVRGDWAKAAEFEVEFRLGTRGAWRPVPGDDARLIPTEVLGSDGAVELGAGQAREYAQALFDACWNHRDEAEARCDYRITSWGGSDAEGTRAMLGTPEGRGGRLDVSRSEDVPGDDEEEDAPKGQVVALLREQRLERKEFVRLLLTLSEGLVEQAEGARGVIADGIAAVKESASQANQLVVDLRKVDLAAYRTEEAGKRAGDFIDKMGPAANMWAQARYTESMNNRKRKPTGSEVRDKFLLLVDGLDLLTWEKCKAVMPEAVATKMESLFFNAETATEAEIVKMWADLREPLTPCWQALQGALPLPVARALSEFAVAVEEQEKGTGV